MKFDRKSVIVALAAITTLIAATPILAQDTLPLDKPCGASGSCMPSVVSSTVNSAPTGSVLEEQFNSVDAWETYIDPERGIELSVKNGIYSAYTQSPGFVWGLNDEVHTDVVLEVQAVPLSIYSSNGFGLMCRADDGNGYFFMITGSGHYAIFVGTDDAFQPLVNWQASTAIKSGLDNNLIRAECVGNQLSLYANNQQLVAVTDNTYQQGFAGMAVAAADGEPAYVGFDNMTIFQP